jgi:hypothetical protein
MQWFGESWGAPICSTCEHSATPVGKLCIECGIPIDERDSGFLVPYLSRERRYAEVAYHRDCFLNDLGIGRNLR